jgi:mRNA interferase MazF
MLFRWSNRLRDDSYGAVEPAPEIHEFRPPAQNLVGNRGNPGTMHQGDIFWIEPDETRGSIPGHAHPHVVVQEDVFNRSRIHTVIVCALTTNLRRADEPGNVLLEPGEGNLAKRSVVVVSQISCVEKLALRAHIGTLSAERVVQILQGLRFQQSSFFAQR